MKPVTEVVVTATSPSLQGEKVVVTDAQGQYRIPQLPPGVYSLRFEKESFEPFTRGDIQLRLDRTGRVNVELSFHQTHQGCAALFSGRRAGARWTCPKPEREPP
ncbi:carboxypeptidase regulatory-like domain-containing protein [Archangium gephyra]|nr:carboxypeptidase regulatory-like domain-containing protein [Archangium gephyra]